MHRYKCGERVWAQETHRVLKSQQISISVISMNYLNANCSPNDYHNGVVATIALGNTWACLSTPVAMRLLW